MSKVKCKANNLSPLSPRERIVKQVSLEALLLTIGPPAGYKMHKNLVGTGGIHHLTLKCSSARSVDILDSDPSGSLAQENFSFPALGGW